MTLDDETAANIAREVIGGGKAARVYQHSTDVALVRAGYAARDAEVEELRAERDEALAVIERAKYRLIYDAPDDIYYDAHVSDALEILNIAPADALRDVKAEVWSEGYEVGRGERRWCVNPYRDEEEVVSDDRA